MRPLLDVRDVTLRTPGGRPLFEALRLRVGREHVALVGRNGVGKSTLLAALAGEVDVDRGTIVAAGKVCFVPQLVRSGPRSHGQQRLEELRAAWASDAEVLLLDEPSEDLDDRAIGWLRAAMRRWPGALVVASHDRRLLGHFRHFFVASESGCRHVAGDLAALDGALERAHRESEARYGTSLVRLARHEARSLHVARRKARKKRYGRVREIDRATPRIRLNEKRGEAEASHGRLARLRQARLDTLRQWSRGSRRALPVHLGLVLRAPELPTADAEVLTLRHVSAWAGDRRLFTEVDLRFGRRRVAVVGPNGAGKTTLLAIMLGERPPATGSVSRDPARIGSIAQGGENWRCEASLLTLLLGHADVASVFDAHAFPRALAERPLRSLSPGERVRAALIALYERSPPVELLVLDEPTFSLDRLGQRAMTEALRAWRGGLVIASHDRAFLDEVGFDQVLALRG